LTQLAACLLYLGKDEAAEQACLHALSLAPDFHEAYRTRAILRAFRGQASGASEDVEHLGWLTGRTQSLQRWHLTILLDYAQTNSEVDEVSSPEEARLGGNAQDDAVTHALLGCLREWERDWKGALREYDEALRANPDHLWALYRRGRVRSLKDPEAAVEDYHALVAHDRADELFGQEPQAFVIFWPLMTKLASNFARSRSDSAKEAARAETLALAEMALSLARATNRADAIADMECAYARALVATWDSRAPDTRAVATHLATAWELRPQRVAELLASDRLFTRQRPLPDWVPGGDPIRQRYPYQPRARLVPRPPSSTPRRASVSFSVR
jgi:tetratricopeptide (TPR) repeat protein